MKAESGIDSVWIQGAWGIRVEQISKVRILSRKGDFYALVCVQTHGKQAKNSLEQTLVVIDPGLDNWLTCVSSLGKSFIVDGHKIKSIKKVSTQLGINLTKVSRAALNLPKRYDLFSCLKKSYLRRCGVTP